MLKKKKKWDVFPETSKNLPRIILPESELILTLFCSFLYTFCDFQLELPSSEMVLSMYETTAQTKLTTANPHQAI